MSNEYWVAALHGLTEPAPMVEVPMPHPRPGVSVYQVLPPAPRSPAADAKVRSAGIATILRWREALSRKYLSQLGEELAWDETNEFERSANTYSGAELSLYYVATVLDAQGPMVARSLRVRGLPSTSVMGQTAIEARRRGFAGRFPQLLLEAKYWLPFDRNMMIEEPDWSGDLERYGSLNRLNDEVRELLDFLATADRFATSAAADQDVSSRNVLASAWQASEMIARQCALAVAQRLPLWITG